MVQQCVMEAAKDQVTHCICVSYLLTATAPCTSPVILTSASTSAVAAAQAVIHAHNSEFVVTTPDGKIDKEG